MDYKMDRAWLEVDLNVLRNNYKLIRNFISDKSEIITVVKADAYGLGAVRCAQTLEACGCKFFATAYFEEAMELRENGIVSPILVLGIIPDEYIVSAIKNNIETSVSSYDDACRIGKIAESTDKRLGVHIAADVGMSRFGITLENRLDEAASEAEKIFSVNGIEVKGILSHMTVMSNAFEREFDYHQINLFRDFTNMLYAKGFKVPRHCSCSAMTSLYPETSFDYIRVGALPFGLQNPLYESFRTDEVIQLKTRVWHIKEVPLNTTVGYGPHYTKRRTRLAVIPVGFGDGLHRSLSDRAYVLINGKRAKIFGKLCMDFTMVDITDIDNVKCGDSVTLFGSDNGESISIKEYADLYSGTACEVSTSLGKRINRVYLN
ncbi:alanine racemase [Lachnospiraceae bacterium NSJ-143]|nr:alanine racemase [Lachnospiraceae bacterium NSJ-143]